MHPGLRTYIQNHPVKGAGPESGIDIDGIVELWFDDVKSAQAFHQWLGSSDEEKECREDVELLFNFEKSYGFLVEEHVLKE